MANTEWKPTACILCECNCGIEVQLGGEDGRRLTRFRGDKLHPTSQGYACEKPHRLDLYQNGPHRLLHPQRRRPDGTFETISWDTAISEVAERLAKVRDTWGGETIFYYGGGGQGNHLPGAYATATRRVLGSRYKSSALAQEKTGEFFVAHRMMKMQTRGDFEHCEVGMFLGKNPWFSHSIPRARVTLKEFAKDPNRTMIVVDPRVTKTAEMADIHLRVKPGTDAWLIGAMVAVMLTEDLVDHAFIEECVDGFDEVVAAFSSIDIADFSARCGIEEDVIRETARVIAGAKTFACFEDLGVQMNRHSTLVSYLQRLLWVLTGNVGKKGTHATMGGLVDFANGKVSGTTPVNGAPIVNGLVPCNVIAEEILSDHEKRYRAMIVESANPAHSLADSQQMREAMKALDTVVVIDVAMSETARLADYVLPAASQFEKAEATFFNFEFPDNYFHLRHRLFEPPVGPLPEAEIHARLCEALGAFDESDLAPLAEAAKQGMPQYGAAVAQHILGNPKLSGVASVVLYRTLGPVLPVEAREGAVLFGLAFRAVMREGVAMGRAGFDGPPPVAATKLFQAIIDSPHGIVMARGEWDDVLARVKRDRVQLNLDDMLQEVGSLAEPEAKDADYPFVLSAGERRSFTANTIIRNPDWRKKDAGGALRMHPDDASGLGVATSDVVRITTQRGSLLVEVETTDTMHRGHVSLPNGMGIAFPKGGEDAVFGAPVNELTDSAARDPFVGTPWHKYVPARIEAAVRPA
ncbi:MAG: molybdopterin-dependent oxidoreductase [Polyangiales bacterium]